ncbi:MAG: hypothetical protein Dbin4_02635, partial [Alphaproteobacteria bacterium]|nr:hypothetical protein [Alphaproteobacteria bacterium]
MYTVEYAVYTVEYFVNADGNAVLDTWLRQLADKEASARVTTRIGRL